MAKTAKLKKKTSSIHSRAARRATSPSLNTDKSLKAVSPPPSSKAHIAHTSFSGDGIRKRKKNPTRAQKQEQRKRVERAEIVVGRTEAKVQKSLGRLKGVKERRKDWEDVNGGRRKKGLMDVDDGGGGGEGVKKLPVLSKVPVEVDDASPAAVGEDEWEDEVL